MELAVSQVRALHIQDLSLIPSCHILEAGGRGGGAGYDGYERRQRQVGPRGSVAS